MQDSIKLAVDVITVISIIKQTARIIQKNLLERKR